MGKQTEYLEYLKPSLQKRQKRRDKRLHEELIECYRGGGGWRSKNGDLRQRVGPDFEKATSKESMKTMWKGGCKWPEDNLEPLFRYVEKHIGQPWNDVFSKLSRQLDKRSATGLHVFQHLLHFVELQVIIEDGKVYRKRPYYRDRELISCGRRRSLYVHPENGLLLAAPFGLYPYLQYRLARAEAEKAEAEEKAASKEKASKPNVRRKQKEAKRYTRVSKSRGVH